MEATPELIRAVAPAIGNIHAKNIGVFGYPSRLRNEASADMLDEIARVAICAIPAQTATGGNTPAGTNTDYGVSPPFSSGAGQ